MYRKYRIAESITSSVSQYESYLDQIDRYTPTVHDIHYGTNVDNDTMLTMAYIDGLVQYCTNSIASTKSLTW